MSYDIVQALSLIQMGTDDNKPVRRDEIPRRMRAYLLDEGYARLIGENPNNHPVDGLELTDAGEKVLEREIDGV